MMNMFKLSEQLKDFSKDQLVREMKMPSGSVPQFLVLTELQRRTRMEREAQGSDGPDQSTVAQDAVAAAGMPQGGVAQMAQALAPKTDMAGNTGIAAMAPPVRRMQEGGGVEAPEDRTIMRRILSALRNRERPVSDDPTGRGERPDTSRFEDLFEEFDVSPNAQVVGPRFNPYDPAVPTRGEYIPDMLDPIGTVMDAVRYANEGDSANAALNAASLVPVGKSIGAARTALEALPVSELYERVMDREAPPTRTREQRMEDAMLGLGVDAEFAYPTRRMQEGGGIGGVPSIAEILADYFRGVSLGIGGAMGGSAAGLVPSGMLNRVSPTDTPPTRPEVSDDPTGRGERPDTSRFEAATLGLGADQEFAEPPTGRGYFPRTEDILQGIATGATFGGAALPLVNPDMAYDVGTSVFGEEPFRRARIIDPARRRLAEQFEEEAEAADRTRGPTDETREVAEQFEEEAEAADREIADLPDGVAPDLGLEAPAAPDSGGGGGGGAGGGAGDIFGDSDRMYEQDKWLSLARFGLGLMSSSQPTLGGAIGEAGAAALDSLGEARDEMLQRRMAQAQLARAGGGGGGAGGMGLDLDRRDLGIFETQLEMLDAQILNARTEGERLAAQERRAQVQRQYDAYVRAYLAQVGPGMLEYLDAAAAPPPEEPVMEARPGFMERAADRVTDFFGS